MAKKFKAKAAFTNVEDPTFRKSSKYITDGIFLMPYTFNEIEDEKCDAIFPDIVDLTVRLFNTNIYLHHKKEWYVLFADVLHHFVLFNKKYIDPFGIDELMASSGIKPCAFIEDGVILYVIMPIHPEFLANNFPRLAQVYSPLTPVKE